MAAVFDRVVVAAAAVSAAAAVGGVAAVVVVVGRRGLLRGRGRARGRRTVVCYGGGRPTYGERRKEREGGLERPKGGYVRDRERGGKSKARMHMGESSGDVIEFGGEAIMYVGAASPGIRWKCVYLSCLCSPAVPQKSRCLLCTHTNAHTRTWPRVVCISCRYTFTHTHSGLVVGGGKGKGGRGKEEEQETSRSVWLWLSCLSLPVYRIDNGGLTRWKIERRGVSNESRKGERKSCKSCQSGGGKGGLALRPVGEREHSPRGERERKEKNDHPLLL